MRISDFIVDHMESILAEWEAFATTLVPAARGLDSLALRDHAKEILEAVARDLETPQTAEEQAQKSKGLAPVVRGAAETAAQTHAVLRARAGFDINQLVAEYRALRASVLRLWMDVCPSVGQDLDDLIRFNEAIDQAVAESVGHFHRTVESYRNLLLGMLGHDMRNPLNSILLTASYLSGLNAGQEISQAAGTLIRSGASMQALLDDLMDFNRTRLGLGIRIAPSYVDLGRAVTDELVQLRAAHPGRKIELTTSGDTCGHCDKARVQQVIRNLVSNAIKYGSHEDTIRVTVRGEQSKLHLEVSNSGSIELSEIREIFGPLKRGEKGQADRDLRDGLGLGLFIVREIVTAHGGGVEVRSEAGKTTFSLYLPRSVPGSR